MQIRMLLNQFAAADAIGATGKVYEKGTIYDMDQPWQAELAEIFVENRWAVKLGADVTGHTMETKVVAAEQGGTPVAPAQPSGAVEIPEKITDTTPLPEGYKLDHQGFGRFKVVDPEGRVKTKPLGRVGAIKAAYMLAAGKPLPPEDGD